MAHKLKKFCKITRYIEQIDGELSQMISDLCLERLFIPRGVAGITFLYPKDEKYRKDIISSAYSNNPEKAIQMLESLIILDHLPRPGDFVLKKDDIPNALRQRIEVASADASSVKLSCGATLHPDPGFAPISGRENMAVYHIKGAQIPLNGPKATMKYAAKRRTKGIATGGNEMGGSEGGVRKYYNEIKSQTLAELAGTRQNSDRILTSVTGFLKFLLREHSDHLAELVHAGRVPPCPLACFFTAVNPLGGKDCELYVVKFSEIEQRSGYGVSKSDDALTEFQNVIKECYALAADAKTHGTESQRRALQRECAKKNVPQLALGPALEAYKTFYRTDDEVEVKRKYLKWHELIVMTLRFIYDANDEQTGEQKAKYIGEAFELYEKVAPEDADSILINPKLLKGRLDPAYMYSGPWLTIVSSVFLGGPMNPESWTSDEGLGATAPDAFNEPQNLDADNLINLHAIMSSMYASGVKAKLTLGGLREMLAHLEK